jgi:hypothetical protein
MGSFEARRGSWSGFTDLIYVGLEGDKSKSVGGLNNYCGGNFYRAEFQGNQLV